MARTKSETAKVAEAEVVDTPTEDIKKENDDLKAQLEELKAQMALMAQMMSRAVMNLSPPSSLPSASAL